MKQQREIRFAFIETWVHWFQGVTAGKLAEFFNIKRQNAQAVITDYKKEYPNNLTYDASKKRQVQSEAFSTKRIKNNGALYLDNIRGENLIRYYREFDRWDELSFEDIDRCQRPNIDNSLLQKIFQSMMEQKPLQIQYQSKVDFTQWTISPHHIVYADNRYHIRAFCHDIKKIRDLVITRILSAKITADHWYPAELDQNWNQRVLLHFRPHSKLPESARKALFWDYSIQNGVHTIECRKALKFYLIRSLSQKIDPVYGVPRWELVKEEKL